MDGSYFDAWTRRRIGMVAGGVFAGALGLIERVDGAAKKRKNKKRRCRKLGKTCQKSDKQKCCGSLKCDTISFEPSTQTRCCKTIDQPCSDNLDCCNGLCCGTAGVCQELCLISDRAVKANFGSVDPTDMLARVRSLPISTWNYTSDDPAIRHIGPMAQDFGALFGVGTDDRHIHPIDGQGTALAAIQGLASLLDALRGEHARLAMRIAAIEAVNDPCVVASR